MRWRGVDWFYQGHSGLSNSLRRGSGGGGQSGSKGARNAGSGGGGSLNDSRNRIATVLGKKELKIQINAGQ